MSPYLSRNQAQEKLIGSKRPFEICPIQISGVNMRTWKNAPDSLRSVIENTQSYGESEFMICGERRVSYADHFSSVCKLSNYLNLTLGISKGDRVILVMRNLPEWSVSFWAITALGAIVVPLNAWLLERELSYCINDCKAKVAILDFKRAEILRPSYSQLGLKTIIIPNPQKNRLLSSEISFENVINASSLEIKLPAAEILPDDDATIFYTSGTTGQPKGAVGSNRNICVNIFSSNFRASVRQLCRGVTPKALGGGPSQAKILVPVPFFHVTGCHAILAAGVYAGSSFVLMHRWDPIEALKLIAKERVKSFVGVPSMVLQMLEMENFDAFDTSSLTSISYGGAPAMKKLGDLISKRLPYVDAENGYGLTEASALVAYNSGEMYFKKSWSCGVASPVCDLKIIDKFGSTSPKGDIGEVCVRGPNVVRGYWNNKQETKQKFVEGWFTTGDIGRIDRDGLLEILDRSEDMLIRGGENIYTIEVENTLVAHPEVIEAAVLGRSHPVLGQEVVGVVRIKSKSHISQKDLILHCAKYIAAFKLPVEIKITFNALPANAAGKILKRDLEKYFTKIR